MPFVRASASTCELVPDDSVSRAGFLGSNPHSNGDLFSRSSIIFLDSIVVHIIIVTDNKMVIDVIVAIIVE
jgi:hypothetical protein